MFGGQVKILNALVNFYIYWSGQFPKDQHWLIRGSCFSRQFTWKTGTTSVWELRSRVGRLGSVPSHVMMCTSFSIPSLVLTYRKLRLTSIFIKTKNNTRSWLTDISNVNDDEWMIIYLKKRSIDALMNIRNVFIKRSYVHILTIYKLAKGQDKFRSCRSSQ